MPYYIVSNKNSNIKGIFNIKDIIPANLENIFLIEKKKNFKSNNGIIYIFFQNLNGEISNLKIFSNQSQAEKFRNNNNSYGYIVGLKPNLIYKNLLEYEYLSLKEIF